MAAGKSAEADAGRELDEQEARLLKVLLKRVIRNTGAGLPDSGARRTSGARTTCGAIARPGQPSARGLTFHL